MDFKNFKAGTFKKQENYNILNPTKSNQLSSCCQDDHLLTTRRSNVAKINKGALWKKS